MARIVFVLKTLSVFTGLQMQLVLISADNQDALCSLQLQNSSALAVGFRVELASSCPSRPGAGADRAACLLGSKLQPVVGERQSHHRL